MAELCEPGVCVADVVALPLRQPVVSMVDLPLPETLGPLTMERIWTGQRDGLFGSGWESIWDLRLDDGQVVGPLPAEPLAEPAEGLPVELADGSTVVFGDDGRLEQMCIDGVACVAAVWGSDQIVLRPSGNAGVEVRMELVDGVVHRAAASDGRTVEYDYLDGQLARTVSAAGTTAYGYVGGKLASIDDGVARSYSYDSDGLLVSMVDRDGGSWAFSSPVPNSIDVERPDGVSRSYRFDAGVLVEVVDAEIGAMLRRTLRDGVVVTEDRPADRIRTTRLADGRLEVTEQRDGQPARRSLLTVDELGRATRVESFNDDFGDYDSLADMFRQIGYDEALHRQESEIMMTQPRYA